MNKHALTDFEAFSTQTEPGNANGFPVGTRVRTEHGERSIETLQPGDRIITRHGKLVPVKSIELGTFPTKDSPVVISKGALGSGLPRRDVMMSPDQNILLADPLLEQMFDFATAMVATRDLLGLDGVETVANITPLAYVKIQCDTPEVLFCSGLACQSQNDAAVTEAAPKLSGSQVEAFLTQL